MSLGVTQLTKIGTNQTNIFYLSRTTEALKQENRAWCSQWVLAMLSMIKSWDGWLIKKMGWVTRVG